MLKIQIGCFTSQIFCLKSWMELRIWEPFVSHSTRTLTFVSWRKLGITSRNDLFVFFRRIIFLLFCFPKRGENIFLLFVIFRERWAKISLCGFSREDYHRESFHSERWLKKTFLFIFIFNSGNYWVVLKLSKTASPFSHLFGSGCVNPLRHPNPTPTIFYF